MSEQVKLNHSADDVAQMRKDWAESSHFDAPADLPGLLDDYDALHAEAEALRVALLEIASVNPAQRGIEWAKSYASDGLKGAGSELYARWLETFKEAEALRDQNRDLRIEADGWFSRVNGVDDKLEALRAENERLAESLRVAHHNLSVGFDTEASLTNQLEAARGLLRDIFCTCNLREMPSEHAIRDISNQIEALLTATQAPEVHAEQGERQEAVAYLHTLHMELDQSQSVVSESEHHPFGIRGENYDDAYSVTTEPLYATPQPGPDVRGLVSADDVRDACANAVSVFAEETNADQCREVAEYMREVLLAQIARQQAKRKGETHE